MAASPEIQTLMRRAIRKYGSEAKLGVACGVKQSSIWQAKNAGPSPRLAMAIEAAMNGEITARELCPHCPWPLNAASSPSVSDNPSHAGGPSTDPIPEISQSPAASRAAGGPVVTPLPSGG